MGDESLTPAEQIVADWAAKRVTAEEAQLRLLAELINAVWVLSVDLTEVRDAIHAAGADTSVRH